MFITKKKHDQIVKQLESARMIAGAKGLEATALIAQKLQTERRRRLAAEQALQTALAASKVALANADNRTKEPVA